MPYGNQIVHTNMNYPASWDVYAKKLSLCLKSNQIEGLDTSISCAQKLYVGQNQPASGLESTWSIT